MAYTVDQNFTNHNDNIPVVIVLGDDRIFTADINGEMKIRQTDGTVDQTFSNGEQIECGTQLNDGRLAIGTFSDNLYIYQTDGTQDLKYTSNSSIYGITQLDNENIAFVNSFEDIEIIDLNGNIVNTISSINSDETIIQLDDGRLAIGTDNGYIKIFQKNGTLDNQYQIHNAVTDIKQLDDGRLLSSYDNVKVSNPSDGSVDVDFSANGRAEESDILYDGRIATATTNDLIEIWELSDKVVDYEFTDHTNNVLQTDQLSDGRLVSGSLDTTSKIFDAGLAGAKTLTSIDTTLASNELLIDQTTTVTVTGNYDDGTTEDVTSSATIFSNDTTIATVSGDTVTPQDYGSTTIQADYNGKSDTAPLDVVEDIIMSVISVDNVTDTQAEFTGEITDRNDTNITDLEIGFDWRPTGSSSWNVLTTDTVSFSNISLPYQYSDTTDQLSEGTQYEFRAYGTDVS
jgi:hypothetical protein